MANTNVIDEEDALIRNTYSPFGIPIHPQPSDVTQYVDSLNV